MTRVMYDGITPSSVPTGASLYAGYVDGKWPSAAGLSKRFPNARVVGIAALPSTNNGIILDVEKGDATPAQSVDWVLMRRKAGVDPTVYMNTSTWDDVRAAFQARKVPEPHYWVAAYSSSSAIPSGAVAIQWKNTSGYDQSNVADYWPGVDPVQETDMALTAADVLLIWGYKNPKAGDTFDVHQGVMNGAAAETVAQQVLSRVALLETNLTALQTAVSNLPAQISKLIGTPTIDVATLASAVATDLKEDIVTALGN